MSELTRRNLGALTDFKPDQTRERISVLEQAIRHAKNMEAWEAGWEAVDFLIREQSDFVAWWDENVGKNWGGNRSKIADRRSCSVDIAEEKTGIDKQRVSKWRKRLGDIPKYREVLFRAGHRKAMSATDKDSERIQQSISNEHYTPARYIEAARAVLGVIDLDPASCAAANEVVKATKYFDEASDGLAQEWHGRVWLNPPYGQLPGKFIAKLFEELAAGRTSDAIVLVNAHCTDTAWFQPLFDGALCFTDHRINFYGDDSRSGSTHGSMFVYFGASDRRFENEFRQFGAVLRRWPHRA